MESCELKNQSNSKIVFGFCFEGPSCSSVGPGAFVEHGLFKPSKNVLVRNDYSWNKGSPNSNSNTVKCGSLGNKEKLQCELRRAVPGKLYSSNDKTSERKKALRAEACAHGVFNISITKLESPSTRMRVQPIFKANSKPFFNAIASSNTASSGTRVAHTICVDMCLHQNKLSISLHPKNHRSHASNHTPLPRFQYFGSVLGEELADQRRPMGLPTRVLIYHCQSISSNH
ncbi:serine carboxypeptidase-like 45 [Senna tora]|uniref:Serine carboxypeptidase-like 45 n=1 Tax=Senna tora TaxID=362788 RepID=A0A834SSM8_9FABA|nr:serine carboxypeptidase-like 45 [Senna tora]